MSRLGLPVPPGFTITTEACRHFLRTGRLPDELRVQVTMAVRHLEDAVGRRLGDSVDPLLVSARSGARFSMPGMMETVLNVGLNDLSVPGLVKASGHERFVWDSYRRLIQMFGKTVLGVEGEAFAAALDAAKSASVSAVFDDPNLVSCAGLAPVVALGQRCGLAELVGDTVTLRRPGGANAHVKVPAMVFGMVAGADCIDDLDLLRHGGMDRLFGGVRAPSTLGTFLRCFTFGHVRQLDAVAARLLARLAAMTPLLPQVGEVAYVDIDDTVREVHGYDKQGVGFGYSGVKGLNALLATLSTSTAAPVIAATRLRKGR